MFGFYRIAAVSPKTVLADVEANAREIVRCAKLAASAKADVAVFPELALTGYSCGDLFQQSMLIQAAAQQILALASKLNCGHLISAVGFPYLHTDGQLYNCAALFQHGKLLLIVPKTYLPNHCEFYEKRYFSSGAGMDQPSGFMNGAEAVPFSTKAVLSSQTAGNIPIRIGVEICEDLWAPIPPSQLLASYSNANLILNLSASNALVSKSIYRRNLVVGQSARCMCVYAYASSGVHESTTDTVYGGHLLIAENGTLLAENKRFQRESDVVYADVDLQRIVMQRLREGSFQSVPPMPGSDAFRSIPLPIPLKGIDTLAYRKINPAPFIPDASADLDAVCSEIFNIQCAGLAGRIESSHAERAIIGISGGLDSTLALLVISETFKLMQCQPEDILAVSMPGFGTTGRTRNNAGVLAKQIGAELRTIDIRKACSAHFADIGHDPAVFDTTYENTQARERTQILMDLANREHGLVVGTGDLSEIALGWSTYNADHISMYCVNCGIPKTLVRYLIAWYAAGQKSKRLQKTLSDILNTPVSPELLPALDDNIVQKTEEILGAYELHDFYLYHFVKYGATPEKIRFLAENAFGDKYPRQEIDRTLRLFLKRFFSQQFKRSCMPDGPKVGTISLSPRADWRMPSDASSALWLAADSRLNFFPAKKEN